MATPKKQTDQSQTTALAKPLACEYMALTNPAAFENLRTTLAETYGDALAPWDFDAVTIPAGGGTVWQVPTIDGSENRDALVGVLVYVQAAREYYSDPYTGEGGPPTCFAPDGKTGYGEPGGACSACPFSQFGSAVDAKGQPARSQACAERKHLLLLPEDSLIPIFLNVPPTSIRAFGKYMLRLAGKGLLWNNVVTEIGLETDKNAGGIAYSAATFRALGALPPEQAPIARQYSEAMGALLRSRLIAERAQQRVAPADDEEEAGS